MATENVELPIQMQITERPDGRTEQIWPLPTNEAFLEEVYRFLFEENWNQFTYGPLIPGASFELRCPGPPESMYLRGGYLTAHWGDRGHFHLCIGEVLGPASNPNSPQVIAHLRPKTAELYRRLDRNGLPISWGFRMRNGMDEPSITVTFSNPYVSNDDKMMAEPDWSRLALWETFLPRFTGNNPDGFDRQSRGFGAN